MLINFVQGRLFAAVHTHIRDRIETNNPSPIIFSRQSAAMLMHGFLNTMVKTAYNHVLCKVIYLSFFILLKGANAEQVCKIIKGLLQRITTSKQLSPIAIGVAYLLRISITIYLELNSPEITLFFS